jgi:hypothetical protein
MYYATHIYFIDSNGEWYEPTEWFYLINEQLYNYEF